MKIGLRQVAQVLWQVPRAVASRDLQQFDLPGVTEKRQSGQDGLPLFVIYTHDYYCCTQLWASERTLSN